MKKPKKVFKERTDEEREALKIKIHTIKRFNRGRRQIATILSIEQK